jgi:hypothetical protein
MLRKNPKEFVPLCAVTRIPNKKSIEVKDLLTVNDGSAIRPFLSS